MRWMELFFETDLEDFLEVFLFSFYHEPDRSLFLPIKFYLEKEIEEMREDPSLLVSLLLWDSYPW